ncbi:MAG: hypothetical protein ABIH86_02730 [Planctomycetota bacterium]
MKVVAWTFFTISVLLIASGIIAGVFFQNSFIASITLINTLASYTTILSLTISISFYAFDKAGELIEKEKQIKSIINTFKQEINTIKYTANLNKTFLEKELVFISDGKYIVNSLACFDISFFGFVKTRSVDVFPNDDNARKIWDFYTMVCNTNDQINSREVFRTTNAALSNLKDRIKQYDEIILEYIKIVLMKSEIIHNIV